MDSDLQHSNHLQPKQQLSTGGGLTRYRSAPSSYFSAFMEAATDNISGAVTGEFSQPPQPRPLSPETNSILARFMDNIAGGSGTDSTLRQQKLYDIPEGSPVIQPQFTGPMKLETEQVQRVTSNNSSNNLSSSSQINYQPISNSIESNFSLPNSDGRSNSNLARHRSSPAGLFDDITIEDGYVVNTNTGTGNFRSGGNRQINFSSGENQMAAGPSFDKTEVDGFMTGFQDEKWNDSTIFSGPDRSGGDFNSPETQNREGRSKVGGLLAHHLSLPTGSIEKLLQFQDTVPCKLRAKRGFATHPRSIAERVRRTKISERMRKLQDLVPNMDKQTNTSDMLDLAVDYIKELQKQVEALAEKRDKCTCTI